MIMASLTITFIWLVVIALLLWSRVVAARRSKAPRGLKPLPGPKGRLGPRCTTAKLTFHIGYPIVGSVPDVPEKNSFIKFSDWGKEYGPIYQVNLAGNNHVWISSDQIARDLLSKKGSIYSDRPHIPALLADNRTSAQYLPLLSRNGMRYRGHWQTFSKKS
jgi:hypothetical protein